MNYEVFRVVAADHPCLSGHFPGNPIVPGVLILEEVVYAVAAALPAARVSGLVAVKFLDVLRPEQRFRIQLRDGTPASIRFECSVDARTIATGEVSVTNDGSA